MPSVSVDWRTHSFFIHKNMLTIATIKVTHHPKLGKNQLKLRKTSSYYNEC